MGSPGPPSLLVTGNFPDSTGGFFPPRGEQILDKENQAQIVVAAGQARNLILRLSKPPANDGRAVATVRRNGQDTALQCRINNNGLQCQSDEVVSFVDGDLLSISYSEVNTPGARVMLFMEYTAAPR